jgi:hypothetical protein
MAGQSGLLSHMVVMVVVMLWAHTAQVMLRMHSSRLRQLAWVRQLQLHLRGQAYGQNFGTLWKSTCQQNHL